MSCPQDLLLDYSAGKLDNARRAQVEAHMKSCAACDTFRVEQAALWEALDLWEPEPVGLDFNRRLWKKIDAAAVPWYKKLGSWAPAVPLTAAAMFIAAGFVLDHRPAAVTPSVSGVAVSAVEAEQAERTLDDIQLLKQLDGTGG